jgi:TPR repeat protein
LSWNNFGKSYKQAVTYFKIAAERGEASAQNNLAEMYEKGEGVKQDFQKAIRYYTLAADQGHIEAQNNLERILHV